MKAGWGGAAGQGVTPFDMAAQPEKGVLLSLY